MEQILGIYARPYDPMKPLWCLDERPCLLIGDTLVPLPVEPGKPQRRNYEYERHGVCTVFLAVQPHTGLTFVQVGAPAKIMPSLSQRWSRLTVPPVARFS
jgi:hypothetical protein